MIIPVKFGDNPPCGLGGDVDISKLLTEDEWWMTGDRR